MRGQGRTSYERHRRTTAALGASGLGARPDRRARWLDRRVRFGADDADEYAPVLWGPLGLLRRSRRLARGRPDPRRARRARLWGAVRGCRGPGHLVGLVPGEPASQRAGLQLVAPSLIDPDEFPAPVSYRPGPSNGRFPRRAV